MTTTSRCSHLLLAALVVLVPCAAAAAGPPVRVVFDTDMASDVDDVGALATLHALAGRGARAPQGPALGLHGRQVPGRALRRRQRRVQPARGQRRLAEGPQRLAHAGRVLRLRDRRAGADGTAAARGPGGESGPRRV